MQYNKEPLSVSEQIDILKLRGLIIPDPAYVEDQVGKIGYFRLANYWRPMEQDCSAHIFKRGSTFDNALRLYYFDKELRALVFTAIQSVEIALRTKIMHVAAMEYGAFWFVDESLWNNRQQGFDNLSKITTEVNRSKEEFIIEHRATYSSPALPPVWKTMEVVSFGTLSKMYHNISDTRLKKKIAREFGLPQHLVLESWMKAMAVLRNFIAHHSRIWNRNFSVKPNLPQNLVHSWIDTANLNRAKIYPQLSCLMYIQQQVHPDNQFASRLKELLLRYPNVDATAMGFPSDWKSQPLWK